VADDYGIAARDYLTRARAELASGRRERLFYAAFELRAGIEQRLHEYLEARKETRRRKARGWKVAKLGAQLDRVFRHGDMVAEITYLEADASTYIGRALYTPVTRALRREAERLGDYLHAGRFRKHDDLWWSAFRSSLEKVADQLADATTGSLMAPPLMRGGGQLHTIMEVVTPEDRVLTDRLSVGGRIVMQVKYHGSVPRPDGTRREG
jgi:hypothetical protein